MTVFNSNQVRQQQLAEEQEEKAEQEFIRNIHAYWDHHPFYRMSVKDFVFEFCGWRPIVELISNKLNTELEKAFLSALFLTGGRIMEVLNLKKENFTIRTRTKDGEKYLYVEGMMLEKRYKKIGDKYKGEDGKNHFETAKVFAVRNPFAIMLKEPLADFLLSWIENSSGGLLFPSPYHHKSEKKGSKCLSRHWAYRLVRFLDRVIPTELKEALGLNRPFIINKINPDKTISNIKISDALHLWLHWFRSMRASQLVQDYHWQLDKLMSYFSWLDTKIALRYLKTSAKGFADSMDVDSYE